jgi:hypothetical protein
LLLLATAIIKEYIEIDLSFLDSIKIITRELKYNRVTAVIKKNMNKSIIITHG